MTLGVSTYAYFWRLSERAPAPMTLFDLVGSARDLGAGVVQICDHAAIEDWPESRLAELRAAGDAAGIRFELGTRGLLPRHLRPYLRIAGVLGASLLRSMINAADSTPTPDEAVTLLRAALPELHDRGITLALETYEQVPTATLLDVVSRIDDARVGICLDPANTVAALEHPRTVVERTAPVVRNVHVKDFAFTRSPGWVGFQLVSTPLGEGQLDYAHLRATVRPAERGINEIVEHWLPWQDDAERTCAVEERWTAHTLDRLRSTQP